MDSISRTQDLQPIYEETCGLYIYRREVITEMGRRIGDKPFVGEVGQLEGVDIDEEENFMIADALFNFSTNKCKLWEAASCNTRKACCFVQWDLSLVFEGGKVV